jgi:hypothetical protein
VVEFVRHTSLDSSISNNINVVSLFVRNQSYLICKLITKRSTMVELSPFCCRVLYSVDILHAVGFASDEGFGLIKRWEVVIDSC